MGDDSFQAAQGYFAEKGKLIRTFNHTWADPNIYWVSIVYILSKYSFRAWDVITASSLDRLTDGECQCLEGRLGPRYDSENQGKG